MHPLLDFVDLRSLLLLQNLSPFFLSSVSTFSSKQSPRLYNWTTKFLTPPGNVFYHFMVLLWSIRNHNYHERTWAIPFIINFVTLYIWIIEPYSHMLKKKFCTQFSRNRKLTFVQETKIQIITGDKVPHMAGLRP